MSSFLCHCVENVGKTSLLIALKAFFQHGFKKKKNTLASRRATVVAETKKKELESKGGQATGDTLSTDGIDIETLQYDSRLVAADAKDKEKSKDDKKAPTVARNITFSCWDFGGSSQSDFHRRFCAGNATREYFCGLAAAFSPWLSWRRRFSSISFLTLLEHVCALFSGLAMESFAASATAGASS